MFGALMLAAAVTAVSGAPPPADARNIALSMQIVQRVGDALWSGWSTTPFQIDLLTQNGPVLVNASTYASVVKRLRNVPLARDKRVDFYAVGAGEALLLDQTAPGWHKTYLDARMDLGVLLR